MTAPVTARRPLVWLPAVAGVGVAVGLGVYGRLHHPSALSMFDALGRPIVIKAGLTSAVVVLAVVQLVSALALYGRLPATSWTPALHRWSGRLAVVLSLPVAVHCLYALGFGFDSPRVLAHSLLGCLFYGAFVAKMLIISQPDSGRPWVLPLAGGLVFTALAGIWLTSALWFFLT
ncbi:hypothetical protein GCM10010168_38180 [Actinoplanes ianthinogenes]|uniref:Uncharacterized protein n=1 Tax=Actinoplanes ianthinogenes TaxID=122358 RepID=A0ABN6CR53_9ACTN|nr:DUF6529 family protein [Actinoplanes ianthinogenes]BCJ46659.1 hypothetical protein Aiant_73160 [Actinoplanes ianthinogenes]GGR16573.1 hypothetical protein GCM10010168_38180 [Actinoplanes ianthinogenes]